MESENFSQRCWWKECVRAAVDLAARLPADNNSPTCETCLMSELSPRLQPVTTSFDNSLRRHRETPWDTCLSAVRCPWQPQASQVYCNSTDISLSACIQSHSDRLISLSVSICLPLTPGLPLSITLSSYLSSFLCVCFHCLSPFVFVSSTIDQRHGHCGWKQSWTNSVFPDWIMFAKIYRAQLF